MKFDKELLFGIILCVVLFMFWNPIMRFFGVEPNPSRTPTVTIASNTPEITSDAQLTVKTVNDASMPAVPTAAIELPPVTISDPRLALVFNPERGALSSITFEQYKQDSSNFRHPAGDAAISLSEQNALLASIPGFTRIKISSVTQKDNRLTVVSTLANQAGETIQLNQAWALHSDYIIDYDVSVTNATDKPLSLGSLAISLGSMSSWGKISGDKMRTDALNVGYYTGQNKFNTIDADDDDEDFITISDIKFAALNNKYFSLVLKGNQLFSLTPSHQMIAKGQFTIGGDAVFALPEALTPGEQVKLNLGFYAGPKETASLEKFSPEAGDLVQLSWGPLNYLAKLLLWILDAFHRWGCSYGWSIILLTLLVRTVFFPVTMKANNSMRKMQLVQPKIKEIREKYKDNAQMQNVKMMELYRTEKINPLGGCLPILLQIPVFFALYSTLDNALQLRHVAFWWSNNLAAPDTVASWALPFSIFGISHFNINPLVIAMTILMVIQQQLTPSTMDPMQKRMMQIMPVVMLFLLYELPSGLTLYWTVSNLFSIFQMLWQNRLNRQNEKQSPAKA